MTVIRVDPEQLKGNASAISSVSSRINSIGNDVLQAAESAPSYDGEFGPIVKSIGRSARSQAQTRSSELAVKSDELTRKSEAFAAADYNSAASYRNIFSVGSLEDGTNDKSLFESIKEWFSGLFKKEKEVPDGCVAEYLVDEDSLSDDVKDIVSGLEDFLTTEEGKKLLSTALAAGVQYVVVDEHGNIVYRWGAKDSNKIVEIRDDEPNDDANGFYYITTNSIAIHNYSRGTLAHEMQHAIDFNGVMGEEAREILNNVSLFNDIGDIETFEALCAAYFTLAIQSEINAHNRGYSVSGNRVAKGKVNKEGDTYTKEEKDFIMDTRGYEETYEDDVLEELALKFPCRDFSVDVALDENGNVKVDIHVVQLIDSIPNTNSTYA